MQEAWISLWSGRSPGEGNANPLPYNPVDRGAQWATIHGISKESETTQQLNDNNSVSPVFSSRSFMVSYLTFSSLNFEFIFVYEKMFQFHCFTYSRTAFPTLLVKETLFSPVYILCYRLIENMCIDLFLGSLLLIYVFVFVVVSHCFDYYSFVLQSEVREHCTSTFILLQYCFGYSEHFTIA